MSSSYGNKICFPDELHSGLDKYIFHFSPHKQKVITRVLGLFLPTLKRRGGKKAFLGFFDKKIKLI